MNLHSLREQIDKIDDQIAALYVERMNTVKLIGEAKARGEGALNDPNREKKIIARVTKIAEEDVKVYMKQVFTAMFETSKAYQTKSVRLESEVRKNLEEIKANGIKPFPVSATVACQGVEGAYAGIAADRLFEIADVTFFKTWEAVFSAVEAGLCEYGVLPIENSTVGSVNDVYDLMKEHKFHIVRSINLRVSHQLVANHGVELGDIKEVVSHEQAIRQCAGFIKTLGKVKVTVLENTAAAAKYVSESGRRDIAAICSRECGALYGLTIVKSNVQDENSNYTRFICISKDFNVFAGSQKISIMTTIPHVPGSLNKLLGKFSMQGLNLTKLESRPLAKHNFEFMFYFDFEGSIENEGVLNLIAELENSSEHFVFLGSYAEMTV